jgi:hypothetical protein
MGVWIGLAGFITCRLNVYVLTPASRFGGNRARSLYARQSASGLAPRSVLAGLGP